SLGRKRFYSALSYCSALIGNSSSGILEAPSFKVPTLNIGNRQKGRAQGNTIVNCDTDRDSIINGLQKVLSSEFRNFVKLNGINPYEKPNTLNSIIDVLTTHSLTSPAIKHFYRIKNQEI
ncbi:MAG: UDP-N-acetylglucosamine 2-epimerase, partial [Muribaculaceae bacterium]|nr:UDP-N-acetylglucosamine 2-epimerase [Muribaculaceae bacterium]